MYNGHSSIAYGAQWYRNNRLTEDRAWNAAVASTTAAMELTWGKEWKLIRQQANKVSCWGASNSIRGRHITAGLLVTPAV